MTQNKKPLALITGGSDGIGLELARLFAHDGYDLILVARTGSDLQAAATELQAKGAEVHTIEKDLIPMGAADELYEEIKQTGKQVDVLVNNAGSGAYGLFVEQDLQKEIDIIHLNIVSLVTLTKHYLKEMVQRGEGKILNLSSIAGKVPGPYQSVYHGTKAFVQSFTEAIRAETADKGVTITALLPGATDTDFFAKAEMLDSKVVQDASNLADPAEVAKDGYEALMAGKDMVVSGFKNKLQTMMAAVTPDAMAAKNMMKQQEPVNADKE